MILGIQIITFLVSILFGILFSFLIDIIKNKLFKISPIFQIIVSIILTVSISLGYFLVLLKLNNAIIHPYYVIAFVIGYAVENTFKKIFKRIVLLIKK